MSKQKPQVSRINIRWPWHSTRNEVWRTIWWKTWSEALQQDTLINYKFIKLQPFIRFVDVSATTAAFIRMDRWIREAIHIRKE